MSMPSQSTRAVVLLVSLIVAETAAAVDPASDPAYARDVEAWRAQRLARLKADGGWLTVAGLAWLKPGPNRFGTDAANEVVLPSHGAPAHGGQFLLTEGRVTVEVAAGVTVTLAGKPVTRAALRTDAAGEPDVLALGPLTMQIIERGGRYGVRIKDNESEARRAFRGLKWYGVKPAYRVTARFAPHDKPTTIPIPSVIGVTDAMPSPGRATFELAGKTYSLDPVLEPGETRLFFIFRDATSGAATYGGGRFLYADPPKDGRVILDFNKAYSPPCAFTPYATCPLPPTQNRLSIAIEAGEMNPEH
jgi:uncharacterized protein (DUF1684 family)